MDMALLSTSPAGCGNLVKMLINLDPHGICGSNIAYLFFSIVQPLVWKMVTWLSRGILVKMLITRELYDIF